MKPLCIFLFLIFTGFLSAQINSYSFIEYIDAASLKNQSFSLFDNVDKKNELKPTNFKFVNDSIYFEYNDDPQGVKLNLKYKHILTYNNNGQLDKKYYVRLDTQDLLWKIEGRYDYFYDQQGNNVEQRSLYFDVKTQDYYLDWRRLYQFDHKNQRISNEFYFWNAEWVPLSKNTQEFGVDGHVINSKEFDWNDTNKEWKKLSETNFKYIKNLTSDSILMLSLNNKTDSFELSHANVITYPSSSKNIIANYSWLANLNSWKFLGNQTILLNAQGKKIFIFDSIQNDSKNVLEPIQYDEFSYDVNGNQECFYPYSWSEDLHKYVLIYKAKYFYSQLQTATKNHNVKQTSHLLSTIVSDNVQIQELENIDQIMILDTDGKKLYSKLNPESIEIVSMSNRPSGAYFVQLIYNNKIHTEIFIKN